MTCTTAITRKSGTFRLAIWEGRVDWPYSASFEWEGHIFVVHHPNLIGVPSTQWVVSHRESGLKVDFSTARTRVESIEKARKTLEFRGRRKLLVAIRKAKPQEVKSATEKEEDVDGIK